VAVVASRAAYEGINAVPNRDLLVAEDPEAFSEAVVRLLREPATRERYAAAGRACVEQNHNWDASCQHFDRLLTDTAAPSRPTRRRGQAVMSPRVPSEDDP
jgi:glycosyltransferase involved in cell wall biosynthesis